MKAGRRCGAYGWSPFFVNACLAGRLLPSASCSGGGGSGGLTSSDAGSANDANDAVGQQSDGHVDGTPEGGHAGGQDGAQEGGPIVSAPDATCSSAAPS